VEGVGVTDAVVPAAGKKWGKGWCRAPRTRVHKIVKSVRQSVCFHCVFPLRVKIRISRSLRQRQPRPTNPPELEGKGGRRRGRRGAGGGGVDGRRRW